MVYTGARRPIVRIVVCNPYGKLLTCSSVAGAATVRKSKQMSEDKLESLDERMAAAAALEQTVRTQRDALIGKVVGERYRVIEQIGVGGWGKVYEVEHIHLKNRLAMKVMHSNLADDEGKIARFKREAQALVALDHPNIARVVDFTVNEDDQFCLMMELLKGASLAAELKKHGPLPVEEALDIVSQICTGLSAAHQKHIIHRDIKPENIWITRDESGAPKVKLIDFGLASIIDETNAASLSLTATGEAIGTPIYMSPEQCRGKRADARTDIYSTGCVLYEILTGKQAFEATSLVEALMKHIEGEYKPLSKAASANLRDTASFQNVIDKALAVDLSDRYQSIEDLAADLQSIREGKHVAQSGSFMVKWRKLQQKKSPTVLVFVLGCATVCLIMLPIVLGRRFDYQMLMFRAVFVFMVWALFTNAKKMFTAPSAEQRVAARWGTLAYAMMLPNAFCFVSNGLVAESLRRQLAQVVYNPMYVRVSLALIAVSLFLSFWLLKRKPKAPSSPQ